MENGMSVKQQEFLWAVQSLLMLQSFNLTLDLDPKDRHRISPVGRIDSVVLALRASRLMPEEMSAEHAAHNFFFWHLDQTNGKGEAKPPYWLLRLNQQFDFTNN